MRGNGIYRLSTTDQPDIDCNAPFQIGQRVQRLNLAREDHAMLNGTILQNVEAMLQGDALTAVNKTGGVFAKDTIEY